MSLFQTPAAPYACGFVAKHGRGPRDVGNDVEIPDLHKAALIKAQVRISRWPSACSSISCPRGFFTGALRFAWSACRVGGPTSLVHRTGYRACAACEAVARISNRVIVFSYLLRLPFWIRSFFVYRPVIDVVVEGKSNFRKTLSNSLLVLQRQVVVSHGDLQSP
jgi:hypothetical protein